MVVIMEEILDTILMIPQILEKKKKVSLPELISIEVKWEVYMGKTSKNHENYCHKCGMQGHWLCTYCMPKHLVDFYQALMKEKRKEIKMNFIDGNGLNVTYNDVDFFVLVKI